MTEGNAINSLRNQTVMVYWKQGEKPAAATLLDFGTKRAMEIKRTQFAEEPSGPSEPTKEKCGCNCKGEMEALENENQALKRRIQEAENHYKSAKMVKKLEKGLRTLAELQQSTAAVPNPKVAIGDSVFVDQHILDGLSAANMSAAKYARSLLKAVFTTEELKGRSLCGKKSNAHKDSPAKEALDPVRLQAVLNYTCSQYKGVALLALTTSLSSMLSRELK